MMRWSLILVAMLASGCVTQSPRQAEYDDNSSISQQVSCKKEVASTRRLTEKQIGALRAFALSQSPELWQTLQVIQGEYASQEITLRKLCKEMSEFGRNPETDLDVVRLKSTNVEIKKSLDIIYSKLEDAYIAYMKMLATPDSNAHKDIMRSALEDGIKEADRVVIEYKDMSNNK